MLFETSLHYGCYIMLCNVGTYKHELRSTITSVTTCNACFRWRNNEPAFPLYSYCVWWWRVL